MNFVLLETANVTIYLGAYKNFCLYFAKLLSDLGENRLKSSEHSDAEHAWFAKIGAGETSHLLLA